MADTWTIPHLLLAWGGGLGNPQLDVWTNTLKCIVTDDSGVQIVLTEAQQQEVADALQAPVETFFSTTGTSSGATIVGNAVTLQWFKANSVGNDGKYVYPNTTYYDYPEPFPAGGGGWSDWRTSAVVTWRTDKARGRAHVGRLYVPAAVLTNSSETFGPYFDDEIGTNLQLAATTLFNTIGAYSAIENVHLTPSIVSASTTADPQLATYQAITSAEVDLVPDTQRRRTNRVPRKVA